MDEVSHDMTALRTTPNSTRNDARLPGPRESTRNVLPFSSPNTHGSITLACRHTWHRSPTPFALDRGGGRWAAEIAHRDRSPLMSPCNRPVRECSVVARHVGGYRRNDRDMPEEHSLYVARSSRSVHYSSAVQARHIGNLLERKFDQPIIAHV